MTQKRQKGKRSYLLNWEPDLCAAALQAGIFLYVVKIAYDTLTQDNDKPFIELKYSQWFVLYLF